MKENPDHLESKFIYSLGFNFSVTKPFEKAVSSDDAFHTLEGEQTQVGSAGENTNCTC
jgi:hypothetical protein